jgi:Holliday junction resolvase RusA-like endonuclease
MPELTIPYGPGVNHTYYHVGNQRRLTPQARQFREDVGKLALLAGVTPMAGEVSVQIDIYRPRKVGDVDGRTKLILDSLQGWAYEDDKQVGEYHVSRYDDKRNPRCVVRWARRGE